VHNSENIREHRIIIGFYALIRNIWNMHYLIETVAKIKLCSGVKPGVLHWPIAMVICVSMSEAMFMFLLIPFLELFEAGSSVLGRETTVAFSVVSKIFDFFQVDLTLTALAVLLSFVAIQREVFSALKQLRMQVMIGKIEQGIQNQVASKMLGADFLSILKMGNGKFMELANIASRETAKVAQSGVQLLSIVITLFLYFTVLVISAPVLALVALGLALLASLILNYAVRKAEFFGQEIVSIRGILSQQIHSLYDHVREIKANGTSGAAVRNLEQVTASVFEKNLAAVTAGLFVRSGLAIFVFVGSIFLVVELQVSSGLNLAIITAGMAMVLRLMPLVLNLTRLRQALASKIPYVKDLAFHIQEFQQNEENNTGMREFLSFKKEIHMQGVSFSYNASNSPVLNRVSFVLERGTSTALIGSSGAGKSTLIDMLPRLINNQAGSILIDGIETKQFDLASLRNKIAYLPQIPKLFDNTIRYNISLSHDCKNDEFIKQLLADVGLGLFVEGLPDKAETLIGETGLKLSGGQAQRLAFARALYKDAELFIFDEPTSAVDSSNTLKIAILISNLVKTRGKTALVVTHDWELASRLDFMVEIAMGKTTYHGRPDRKLMNVD